MLELLNAETYVGTYDKYYSRNCLDGAWMHLANYTSHDEYIKACAEVHKDEADPRFMIQDTSCLPTEYRDGDDDVYPELWNVLNIAKSWSEDKQNSFQLYCDDNGEVPDMYSLDMFEKVYKPSSTNDDWMSKLKKKDNHIAEILCISKDTYTIIPKPYMEKSFCFGYSCTGQGQTFDEAQKQYESFNGDKFKAENLKSFDKDFPLLKEGESLYFRILQRSRLSEYYKQEANIFNEEYFKRFGGSDYVKMEKEVAEPFIKAYNDAIANLRSKYEKQIDTYLKKYGISKLKIWTYCCDD